MTQPLLSKALKGIREEGHAGNRKIWLNLFSSPCQKKEVTLGKRLRRFHGARLPFSITHLPYLNQRLMRLCRVIPSCRSAGLITSGDTPGELPFTPKTSIGTYAEEESCHGGGSGRRNDEPY